ncbi:hypothetical protein [Shimazuella alba]|uniref:Uncharacterized protein n=1 Tax=Shimazuella alba TaxID=2690964 RepID=A0A6I4VRM2_9BACL|nr:hypothetical protein [Shimazuella alba]MXQ52430.1 hypothetical protein [Shimazuella alba]
MAKNPYNNHLQELKKIRKDHHSYTLKADVYLDTAERSLKNGGDDVNLNIDWAIEELEGHMPDDHKAFITALQKLKIKIPATYGVNSF